MRRHLLIANQTAERMFAEFQDTSFHGAAFCWKTFPDLVARQVLASLFMSYARTPKDFEAVKQAAAQCARVRAKALVEASDDLPVRQD